VIKQTVCVLRLFCLKKNEINEMLKEQEKALERFRNASLEKKFNKMVDVEQSYLKSLDSLSMYIAGFSWNRSARTAHKSSPSFFQHVGDFLELTSHQNGVLKQTVCVLHLFYLMKNEVSAALAEQEKALALDKNPSELKKCQDEIAATKENCIKMSDIEQSFLKPLDQFSVEVSLQRWDQKTILFDEKSSS
jgi:hypothetical protein